ncbi:Coronin [Cercospora zeina]
MSGRFVRASKYRHVFGQNVKREQCYDNIRVSRNAWDSNLIKANPKYIAVNWESGGGGAFAVIPLEERGKLPDAIPLFRGHTAVVLDTDWSPFDDSIIASASDDGKVFLWQVPENFQLRTDAEEPEDVKPVGKLSGHSRKVGHVLFNPAAENVLASSSGDFTIKIWDLEDGRSKLTLKGNDIFTSMSWSADGSTLVTTSRDKKLRFWDVRQERPAHEVPGHSGAKISKVQWMGDHDRVVTTGFSKMSERQMGLWDIRNPTTPIGDFVPLDSGSGVVMPFWDDGSQILYLAGKGDGNIRYFEYVNDKFEFLSEYRSPNAQRGLAFMPKRGVNTHDNEITRAFKSVDDLYIEPISFVVPRRAETFQDDIYPPTVGTQPAMSSEEWFQGTTALPPKLNMEDLFDGVEPQMLAAEARPRTATTSAPAPAPAPAPKAEPKPEPKVEPTPAPAAATRELPTVNQNKQSMATMADKFADKDEDEEDVLDDSSFEEIQKPVERPSVIAAKQAEATKPSATTSAPARESRAEPKGFTTNTGEGAPAAAVKPASELCEESKAASPASAAAGPSASAAAGGLREVLNEIRTMLQVQSKQIEHLTTEVAQLKSKLGE